MAYIASIGSGVDAVNLIHKHFPAVAFHWEKMFFRRLMPLLNGEKQGWRTTIKIIRGVLLQLERPVDGEQDSR